MLQNCTNSRSFPERIAGIGDERFCNYSKKRLVGNICKTFNYIGICKDSTITHSVTGGNIFENESNFSYRLAVNSSDYNPVRNCVEINSNLNLDIEYQIALPCRFCEDNLSNQQKDSAYVDIHNLVYRDDALVNGDLSVKVLSATTESYYDKDSLNFDDYFFECYANEKIDSFVQDCPSYTQCIAKVRVEFNNIYIYSDSYYFGYSLFNSVPEYDIAFLLLDKEHDLSVQTNVTICELGTDFELEDLKALDNSNCHLADHIVIQPIPICYPRGRDHPKARSFDAN